LTLKEQVSHLLDAVLQRQEPSGRQGADRGLCWTDRDHVEEILVQQITEVIDKVLTNQSMATDLHPEADVKSVGHEEEGEEKADMSMALVRVEKSDCDSSGDGDLSEHENVYDVFDLRKERMACSGQCPTHGSGFRLSVAKNFSLLDKTNFF
jgi:hypothetical protein